MRDPINVVWQTDAALAVNKPAGIATQSPREFESVESILRRQLCREESYLAFPHRLDRWVSGVLLVAKTKRAARLLSGQFASRKTSKRYVAVVDGVVEKGVVDRRWEDHLRKIPGQPRVEICDASHRDSKQAVTDVQIVSLHDDRQTRLHLRPITGRMHQLRIQSASRGHPIVGDRLYGSDVPAEGRILLHADRIEFFEPTTGKRMTVEAECPF